MDVRTPVPTIYGGTLEQYGELWKNQIAKLREAYGEGVEEVRMPMEYPTDVPIVYARAGSLIPILQFLKESAGCDYQFLADITATDEEVSPRFEVVYNLFSHVTKARIRVKVRVEENATVPTASGLWLAANWPEREVYDMYGVRFEGHPDLRRILMDDRWQGHPLRKDYPLRGYQIFPDAMTIKEELLKD